MNPEADGLQISSRVAIPLSDIEMQAVRAQGPGGQHVNKVSTAIHLRFDVGASSLPQFYKDKLLAAGGQHLTREGVIVIKAQSHRSQEKNKADALARLGRIIVAATQTQKRRRATRPTKASVERRLTGKSHRSKLKRQRKSLDD